MNDKLKPLIGRKSIQEHLEIGTTYFYTLRKAGLPVKRVGGRLTAHRDELDEWFRVNQGEQSEPE